MSIPVAVAQQPHKIEIRGTVIDSTGKPVSGASVHLGQQGSPDVVATTTPEGIFAFEDLQYGTYLIKAEKNGLTSRAVTCPASARAIPEPINLILEPSDVAPANAGATSPSSAEAMAFADQPNFTVAGVTDWTAVGGHGSDASLRTSEALTRETLTLKPEGSTPNLSASSGSATIDASESRLRAAVASAPQSFEANHQLGKFYFHAGKYRESIPPLQTAYQIDPANHGNEYDLALAYRGAGDFAQARDHIQKLLATADSADLHRLLGELDEKLDDPLAAVHEDEQAARLDPSEENYFAWGSELLLHRAVWQAAAVFRNGVKAYPKSARMLTALGTALFAGALYDEAALRLCDASDLNPADPEPYIFMGKIEMAAPAPLPCVEQKLARFVQQQPENALANYFYAMAIWKRQEQLSSPEVIQQVETLLTKAVTIDAQCSDAYLQLGILYFTRRDFDKAISFYKKAIEANPQMGDAHYRLGVAYDRTGEAAKAQQEFQLHDEIEKSQAADIERQRREVKQFLVVLQKQPADPSVH
ncbi:tetratricopeptide repeat protein [Acidobacterium sp. S8]|uniref:tetratricopeptide repeat protein n=1 Tax=Acidobacterium sp. S8 TaxID=1641854 RepID=UPI0020B177A1|nr:tetratricopeptide repeat protein [Acidobacterium sp. S8]